MKGTEGFKKIGNALGRKGDLPNANDNIKSGPGLNPNQPKEVNMSVTKRFTDKHILAVILTVILALWAGMCPGEEPALRPNILLVLTDDVGWGDAGCYNPNSKIPTPNIDRLAAEGMLFTHAHTPAALCAPTRYAMLTGNYPWRGRRPEGTWFINKPSQLMPGQKTVAQLLKPAGYHSAMFGKAGTGGYWGMKPGQEPKHTPVPIEWGFDYSYLIPRGHQASPYAFFENGVVTTELINDSAPGWDHAEVGGALLEKAIAFLDDHQKYHGDRPFYIHFCTDGAHIPYVPADTLAGKPLKGATGMTELTDMVYETDILLGALLEALEQRSLRENTLVIYTSDNGGLPYKRDMGHDAVAGLRGGKSFIYEGGNRVVFVASWPGQVPAGTVRHQLVGTHDVVATALDLAGVAVQEGQVLDAVSLAPVLLGRLDDTTPVRRTLLVQSSGGRGPFDDGGFKANGAPPIRHWKKNKTKKKNQEMAFAVYEGDWKLILYEYGHPAALFNLGDDLGEEHNLIEQPDQKKRVNRMTHTFKEIRSSVRSTPR